MSDDTNVEMHEKLTLKSGKTVTIRPSRIMDEIHASSLVPQDVSSNPFTYQIHLQMEIIKMRLVKMNDKPIPMEKRENLDNVFSQTEWEQVIKHLKGDAANAAPKPRVEHVKGSGAQ